MRCELDFTFFVYIESTAFNMKSKLHIYKPNISGVFMRIHTKSMDSVTVTYYNVPIVFHSVDSRQARA